MKVIVAKIDPKKVQIFIRKICKNHKVTLPWCNNHYHKIDKVNSLSLMLNNNNILIIWCLLINNSNKLSHLSKIKCTWWIIWCSIKVIFSNSRVIKIWVPMIKWIIQQMVISSNRDNIYLKILKNIT